VVVFAGEDGIGGGGGRAYNSMESALAEYLDIPENTVCEWMLIMKQTEQAIARSREIRDGATLDG